MLLGQGHLWNIGGKKLDVGQRNISLDVGSNACVGGDFCYSWLACRISRVNVMCIRTCVKFPNRFKNS